MELIAAETTIINYTATTITTKTAEYHLPCFISSNTTLEGVTLDDIPSVLQDKEYEILLIGSDTAIDMKTRVTLHQLIPTECMSVRSAIYSFNILISDKRNVALALLKKPLINL